MKNKYINIIAASLAIIGTSCNESSWNEPTEDTGELLLSTLNIQVDDRESVITKATPSIDVDNFLITVTDAEGKEQGSWTYKSMPEVLTLPTAQNYTLKVESHKVEPAAWDAPYYLGTASFDIRTAKITQVGEVEAKFASLKVSIKFDDELKKVLDEDAQVVVRAKGNNNAQLVFTPTETRSGYFEFDNATTFAAHFSATVDGSKTESATPFENVAPGQHHIITYKIKNGPEIPEQSGTIDPGNGDGIEVDADYEIEDSNGNIIIEDDIINGEQRPGEEDPQEPEDPKDPGTEEPGTDNPGDEAAITFEAFDSPNLNLNKVNVITEETASVFGNAIVRITSKNGIKEFDVEISSDTENPLFMGALESMEMVSFSLIHPTEVAKTNLQNLELPYEDQVLNQNIVDFNISAFIELLVPFNGTHSFLMTVEDNEGEIKSLNLRMKVE